MFNWEGNWYADIFIPDKYNFSAEANTFRQYQNLQLKMALQVWKLPVSLPDKTELGVAWMICLRELSDSVHWRYDRNNNQTRINSDILNKCN